MIYQTPALEKDDELVLGVINSQRESLRTYTQNSPKRWMGSLRRSTLARAIRASNSIEGINASIENVLAAVDNDDPSNIQKDTWQSIKGYRDAMTYIMQAAQDPHFEFSKQFLKSLQFMMVGHDMAKNPGQWRPGPIYVVNGATNEVVYEGPPAEMVNALAEELVAYLRKPTNEPPMVRAAMAHLNLTMIHPFKDGNGRVARALQTLVLARDGILHPVFSSIEEWLGKVTQDYYAVLSEVGQGKWTPERSALPWVRFCLQSHFHQAATLLRRNEEYEKLFTGIQQVVKRNKLPDRMEVPLFDAALGFQLTNTSYRLHADVTDALASRDLKRLCDAELLNPKGEKRGRRYEASAELKTLRKEARGDAPYADPYEMARAGHLRHFDTKEPRIPGLV
jgi:Fic family protein